MSSGTSIPQRKATPAIGALANPSPDTLDAGLAGSGRRRPHEASFVNAGAVVRAILSIWI